MTAGEREPTPLGERIADLIAAAGPMPIGEYMQICLADPRHGYYRHREAIGATGDFITAPEISQIFGELLGVWCALAWHALGKPPRLNLVEAGPGRGTLMSDLLRATGNFAGFHAALDIHLIELSAAMRERQASLLLPWRDRVSWHELPATIPDGPTVLIANEFLDALPFRQYVKTERHWRERGVGVTRDGSLRFTLCAALLDEGKLPPDHDSEPEGAIFETSPAREAFVETVAGRLKRDGGFALFVDYGHGRSGFGDTFQAARNHKFTDPLIEPGLADLTSHVDFAALAATAKACGLSVSPVVTQAQLLVALGLESRLQALAAKASADQQITLIGGVHRLIADDQMGKLFKALAIGAGADPAFPPFGLAPSE
jgi:SAM-dependent MidA family methyltransferase